jgi:hypothetical protein
MVRERHAPAGREKVQMCESVWLAGGARSEDFEVAQSAGGSTSSKCALDLTCWSGYAELIWAGMTSKVGNKCLIHAGGM